MTKRLITICLLMFAGVSVGVLSSEAMVRMFVPLSDFLWQWDPLIGMKLIPGKQGRSVKPGLYDVSVDVNSEGFRDREHSVAKPDGVRRVALVGDSVVESLQVPFESSITPMIEKGLERSGIRSEVLNFGVSGTGTAREYLAVREYALKYRPDLVLLFFVENDFGDNTRELKSLSYIPYPQTDKEGHLMLDESGDPQFTKFEDQKSRFAVVTDVLRDHFKSYRLVRETLDTMPGKDELWAKVFPKPTVASAADTQKNANFGLYEIYRRELRPQWVKGTNVTYEMLLELRDLTARSGVEFGVVIVPAAWEVYPDRWQEVLDLTPGMRAADVDVELPSKNLTQFLAKNNIRVIDPLLQFQNQAKNDQSLYLRGDGHWTAAGHRLAADIVSNEAAKILGSTPSRLSSANVQ